jgi:ceramide glucosyltransferase
MGTSLLYYLFSFYCTAKFFKKKGQGTEKYLPPVSLLKPVKGVEPGIYQDFASFCYLEYPKYQVIFGLVEKDDPAVSVIERILDEYPDRDISLHRVGYEYYPNEKVWILQNLLRKSKYDILIINDADIRVRPDYLRAIVPPLMNPDVGLVTTPYRAIMDSNKGLYSLLTSLYINTDFFPAVMVANKLSEIDFGLGATLAIKKEVLTEIGGFEALANLLADDYHLGNKVYKTGYKVALVPYLVDTLVHHQDFQGFFQQQLRWARTLRVCRPWGYFCNIITHGITASTVFLLLSKFSCVGLVLFLLILITRLVTASRIASKFLNLSYGAYYIWIWLLPLRDLLATCFWLLSFLGNTVTWRNSRFVLDRKGRINKV